MRGVAASCGAALAGARLSNRDVHLHRAVGDPLNSGYKHALISPGVELNMNQRKLYADAESPVYQDVTGNQLIVLANLKFIASYAFYICPHCGILSQKATWLAMPRWLPASHPDRNHINIPQVAQGKLVADAVQVMGINGN